MTQQHCQSNAVTPKGCVSRVGLGLSLLWNKRRSDERRKTETLKPIRASQYSSGTRCSNRAALPAGYAASAAQPAGPENERRRRSQAERLGETAFRPVECANHRPRPPVSEALGAKHRGPNPTVFSSLANPRNNLRLAPDSRRQKDLRLYRSVIIRRTRRRTYS